MKRSNSKRKVGRDGSSKQPSSKFRITPSQVEPDVLGGANIVIDLAKTRKQEGLNSLQMEAQARSGSEAAAHTFRPLEQEVDPKAEAKRATPDALDLEGLRGARGP